MELGSLFSAGTVIGAVIHGTLKFSPRNGNPQQLVIYAICMQLDLK